MTPHAELTLWFRTLAEAKARQQVHLAAAVYARRAGEPCPFLPPAEAPAAKDPVTDTVLHIDFETRSRVDLTESGQDRYAQDPSTSILLLGYALGDHDPQILRTLNIERPECPSEIRTHIEMMLPVAAHNAAFEAAMWRHICVARWGWPPIADSMWLDTMALAAIRSLPMSLAGCAAALGLQQQKSDAGRRIMLKWCKPRTPTKTDSSEWAHDPLEYDALADYCMQDVRVEREVHRTIGDAMRPDEREVWLASWRMNHRGIPLDTAGAQAAQKIVELAAADWAQRVSDITAGAITADTIGSRKEVLQYLHSRGVHLDEWDADTVGQALDGQMPEDARLVLQARLATGRSSTAKAAAMLARVSADGRIRDQFVYHGATTGRWTARGIQPQNLPRDQVDDVDGCLADAASGDLPLFRALWGEPADAIAGCIRGLIRAPDGCVLVAGDYAQIEARVLLWLAQDAGVALFGPGKDIYCEMASRIYGRTITKADKQERQLGKAAILGCGFGMGSNKFFETCQRQGQIISVELADAAVAAYRERFPKVKQFWYACEDAAIQAVNDGDGQAPRKVGRIAYAMRGGDLKCRLPSGRLISYPKPVLQDRLTPWQEMKKGIAYWSEGQMTRKWELGGTYGGKLVENATQAVARDIMAAALVRADAAGWEPIMTVHDELVCVCADPPIGKDLPRELESVMVAPPAWADGLPIAAEAWSGKRYTK